MLGVFFDNLGKITIGIALFCAAGQVVYYISQGHQLELEGILQKTLSGAGSVAGLALLIGAFDTSLLMKITNLEIYILVAGISILYVSYIGIFPRKQKPNP